MSQPSRPLNPSIRHPSLGGLQSSSGQSPLLLSRINEKKAELENLKQLRDLSGGLAAQMEALEQKLSTLSNGTEGNCLRRNTQSTVTKRNPAAVATVLSNWHNVMRAINMASSKYVFREFNFGH